MRRTYSCLLVNDYHPTLIKLLVVRCDCSDICTQENVFETIIRCFMINRIVIAYNECYRYRKTSFVKHVRALSINECCVCRGPSERIAISPTNRWTSFWYHCRRSLASLCQCLKSTMPTFVHCCVCRGSSERFPISTTNRCTSFWCQCRRVLASFCQCLTSTVLTFVQERWITSQNHRCFRSTSHPVFRFVHRKARQCCVPRWPRHWCRRTSMSPLSSRSVPV